MEHARHTRNRFFFKHINAYLHSHLSGARTFYPYPYDHLLETESTCLKIDEVTIGRSLSTGTLPPTEKRRIYKTLKRGTTVLLKITGSTLFLLFLLHGMGDMGRLQKSHLIMSFEVEIPPDVKSPPGIA